MAVQVDGGALRVVRRMWRPFAVSLTEIEQIHATAVAFKRTLSRSVKKVPALRGKTIVNLVAAGLGLAWVPQSVSLFQRSGVVYRSPAWPRVARTRAGAPLCETRLIWPAERSSPVVARFVDFVRAAA